MQRYSFFTITIIVLSLLFGQVRFVMTETLVSTQPCTMENMSYEHLTHDALLTDSDAAMQCCESPSALHQCCDNGCQCSGVSHMPILAFVFSSTLLELAGNMQIMTSLFHTPQSFWDNFKRPPKPWLS